MSLSSLLNDVALTSVSDDQGAWRQFILDHLDYIQARSRVYVIQPEVANLYRYDLTRLLREKLTRHADIAWIVQLLNYIPNDFSFNEPRDLVIPTDDLINKLYLSYRTISSNPI